MSVVTECVEMRMRIHIVILFYLTKNDNSE